MSKDTLFVKCFNCGEIYFATTPLFDPTRVCNATMLKIIEPYKSQGWQGFSMDESTIMDALECPGCAAPLCNGDGHVRLVDREGNPVEFSTLLPARPEDVKEPDPVPDPVPTPTPPKSAAIIKGKKFTLVKGGPVKEREYICNLCGEVVIGSSSLGGHMAKHAMDKKRGT